MNGLRGVLFLALAAFAGVAGAGSRLLILDEDNDHYFKNPAEWMDEAHLNAYIDSIAAGGKVTHIFFCPAGGRSSFDSKVWEPVWKGLEEQPADEIMFLFRRWSENAKMLCEKGIDPYQVWIRRCREKGISPWLSPRMNDAHDGAAWGRRKPYRSTTLWRERRDLRCYPECDEPSWRHHQFDYSRREVRENALAMIRELFERYDFDGLNLHANRWFPDETARSNIPVMTAFVREVRKIADEWEERRGHKIGLSVCRAGFTPEACRDRGFDAAAMAREGLLDIICCQPDGGQLLGDILPVDLWRMETGGSKTAIVAGRGERLFQGRDRKSKAIDWMNFTAEMFRGWADQQMTAGADGLYLFNVEYQPKDQKEICRTGLMPEDILTQSRVYPCLTNCLPVRVDASVQFAFAVGAATGGVVSVVAAFSDEVPGLPDAKLNGIAPVEDVATLLERETFDEMRAGRELYVGVTGPARRLVFPACVVRTGLNSLTLGDVADAELRYLELRIDPEPEAPKRLGEGWKMFDRRLGLFIHWGIYSVGGHHEQEQMRLKVPRAEYAKYADCFFAEKFDADNFVDAAKSLGADYIVFTAKHHDGFCMWDTKTTDFKVTNTPAGRDVLRELTDACKRRGMKLGLYYSNPDWHHPNAYNSKSSHQIPPESGDEPDLDKYRSYVKSQIRELLTQYGEIVCLFWDIPTKVSDPEMNELVRSLQPGILINDRGWGDDGDYSTPERNVPPGSRFVRLTEACDSVGADSWGYRKNEDYRTKGYLTRSIDAILSMGGNFLLNVGPKPDGTLPDESLRLLAQTGAWHEKVRESYLNVETVTGVVSDASCFTTVRGSTLYLHYPRGLNRRGLDLSPLSKLPRRAILLNDGRQLKCELVPMPKTIQALNRPCLHVLDVPADDFSNESVVIRLDFNDNEGLIK